MQCRRPTHLLKNFPQFIVIHIVKGFGIVNKAEIDVFLELSCFFHVQWMLAIWSPVPLPFLKPAWTSGSSWFMYCWSLAWKILSITLLADRHKPPKKKPRAFLKWNSFFSNSSYSGSQIQNLIIATRAPWAVPPHATQPLLALHGPASLPLQLTEILRQLLLIDPSSAGGAGIQRCVR